MEKINTKQEILLLTTSSFTQGELCEKDSSLTNSHSATPVEKLEEACWNGLLTELLRGLLISSKEGEKIFLWKTHVAEMFLCIELSKAPYPVDCFHSLDPYLFLSLKNYN